MGIDAWREMGPDPVQIRHQIEDWMQDHVCFDGRAADGVLGFGEIWRCPAELYDHLTGGEYVPSRDHSRAIHETQMHVADVISRLTAMGVWQASPEIVSEWDDRFRGQPAGQMVDARGESMLLLVAPVGVDQFDDVRLSNRALQRDYEEMQLMLFYANADRGLVIYKCRDDGHLRPVIVWAHEGTQMRMEKRARDVLAAVDAVRRPACECGRH